MKQQGAGTVLSYQKASVFIVTLVLAFITYWGGIAEAYTRWNTQEEYSHGFLIPLVSLYILWEKKDLILSSVTRPMWSGYIIVLLSLLIYILGQLSALFILIQYSFVLTLVGLSMIFLGKASRYTLAPLLLLLFAIPLPYVIEVVLTAKLQLVSSWLGVQVIRLFDIPVYLEGNIIDLGVYKLQVVEACSGLRYLFPLMSLGFIAAYFYRASFWKKAVVFLATIPITILMNSFRIGVIGVLVDNWGIAQAEGFLHDFEGWIIFMACAGLLALLIWLMEKLTTGYSFADVFGVEQYNKTKPIFYENNSSASGNLLIFGLTILTLISSYGVTHYIDNRQEIIPEHKALVNFPMKLDEWTGYQMPLDDRVESKLAMTDYLLANYQNKQKQTVNFYVAYYETQRKGESPHSPRVCIPGGGWEIAAFDRIEANGHPANRVIIKKGTQEQLVYYWFQGHGRIVANEYINKWYLLQDSIIKNRTDGSLVRMVTMVADNETVAQAEQRILSFMKVAEPKLKQYIAE